MRRPPAEQDFWVNSIMDDSKPSEDDSANYAAGLLYGVVIVTAIAASMWLLMA